MTEQHNQPHDLTVPVDQPLIGIIYWENGREVVRYTTEDVNTSSTSSTVTEQALAVIGAWSDLDWDETERALDRIRHESVPTPLIEEL